MKENKSSVIAIRNETVTHKKSLLSNGQNTKEKQSIIIGEKKSLKTEINFLEHDLEALKPYINDFLKVEIGVQNNEYDWVNYTQLLLVLFSPLRKESFFNQFVYNIIQNTIEHYDHLNYSNQENNLILLKVILCISIFNSDAVTEKENLLDIFVPITSTCEVIFEKRHLFQSIDSSKCFYVAQEIITFMDMSFLSLQDNSIFSHLKNDQKARPSLYGDVLTKLIPYCVQHENGKNSYDHSRIFCDVFHSFCYHLNINFEKAINNIEFLNEIEKIVSCADDISITFSQKDEKLVVEKQKSRGFMKRLFS